jgi:hypothetical protein
MPPEERVRQPERSARLWARLQSWLERGSGPATKEDLIAWRPPHEPTEVLTLAAIETIAKAERETIAGLWIGSRNPSSRLGERVTIPRMALPPC